MHQVWTRDKAAIAVESTDWLGAYEFEADGNNQTMFLPNGLNTVEWRLGWTVREHNGYALLIVPSPSSPSVGVQIGLLSPSTLDRHTDIGFSIAIAPSSQVNLTRGDEIARLIPVSKEMQRL